MQQQQQQSNDVSNATNYRNLEMEQQPQQDNGGGIIATSLNHLSYIKNEILNPLPDQQSQQQQYYYHHSDERTINSNGTKSDYV